MKRESREIHLGVGIDARSGDGGNGGGTVVVWWNGTASVFILVLLLYPAVVYQHRPSDGRYAIVQR